MKKIWLLVALIFIFTGAALVESSSVSNVNASPSSNTAAPLSTTTANPKQQIIQKAIQNPGIIEKLRQNPNLDGLSPREIQMGKELLKQKQVSEKTQKPAHETAEVGRKKELSLFSQYINVQSGNLSVHLNIHPFGYSIFRNRIAQPLSIQPVPSNYIIGPGDEISVLLWGRVNAQYNLRVKADGTISLPYVGPLTVAGMKYSQMQNFLTQQVQRIVGTKTSITLSKLHQIEVFVLGEVKHPGLHNLPAMSTMINALISAGGPTQRGSLRNIRLKRKGKIIDTLDTYSLLLKGDNSHDKILRNNDIVFVPLIGPLVGVAGEVTRPGIYELKQKMDINDVLKLSGGLLPNAWNKMIQIERFNDHAWKKVVDINAAESSNLKKTIVKNGDLIKVFPVISSLSNAIVLKGNIVHSGTYAYYPGMRLSSIIKDQNDILPDTYMKYALIKRYTQPYFTETKIIPFNLSHVLDKTYDIKLQPLDHIYVFPRNLFESKPQFSVYGSVRYPGVYKSWDSNFRLKDLIMMSGGLRKNAYLKKAEIISYKVENGTFTKLSDRFVDLRAAMSGNLKYNILLKPYDNVFIRKALNWGNTITASIKGEVKFPGTYVLKKQAALSDLISKAGGYKNDAYLYGANLIMPSVQKIQQNALKILISRLQSEIFLTANAQGAVAASQNEAKSNELQMNSAERFIQTLKKSKAQGRVVIRLAPLRILKGSPYDLKLENNSMLYIPRKKDIINVVGAVMSSSSFIYTPDFTYKNYIQLAGGYTSYADESNIYVISASGSAYKVKNKFTEWNPFKSRWEMTAFAKKNQLEPGDTVVVPAKLQYVPWLRNIKDISQIMMQMAVTTGVVFRLF